MSQTTYQISKELAWISAGNLTQLSYFLEFALVGENVDCYLSNR